ncbi:MAG: oligosaccharide flippase family protein [Actinomycetota bacterium]
MGIQPPEMELPTPAPGAEPSLARRAAAGVAWEGLSYVLGKLLLLVSTVVLARILAPHEFGVVALAMVFILFVEQITDLGVAEALVYLPPDRRRTDAALAITVGWSAVLVAVALLISPAVARFFGGGEVGAIFRVLSAGLVLRGLTEVPDALLRKDLRFRRKLVANVGQVVVQAGVSIALAAAGAGPWAIVYGYLAGTAVWSVVAWALVEYRPSARFWILDREVARPLLRYGLPVAGEVLLLALVFNVDYLIVGRRLGADPLAYYSLAFRVPQMVIINVLYVLGQVAFPVYTIARADRAQLREAYLGNVRVQSVYGVCAGVGLAMVAPMLVRVVFGVRWSPAIVPLEGLALYTAFRSVGLGAGEVLKGVGRPMAAVALALLRAAVLVPVLLLSVGHGIDAVATAQATVAFSLALVMEAVAARAVGVSGPALVSALTPAVVAGAATAAGAAVGRWLVPGPDVVRLVVGIALGGGAGFGALLVADRPLVRRLIGLMKRAAAEPTA